MLFFQMSTCLIIWLMIFTLGLVKESATLTTPLTEEATVIETDDQTITKSHLEDDLENAETKDLGQPKLEIIKQIRKLNQDGSYTVGYEADDGTFKIESRDVLGNVKGTYGYVDINGEIKRVSYTTNNVTNRPIPKKADEDEVVQIPRQNKTSFVSSTTRRPQSLAFLTTSPATPTRSSVVQTIPKKRILLTASSERPTYTHYHLPRHGEFSSTPVSRKAGEPTTTVVYATSVPTNRSSIAIRPTPLPGTYKTAEQILRPDKLEITDHVSRVKISSNREGSKTKPVTEEDEEREHADDEKRQRGNFVRRQLTNDDHDEKFEAQQQVIYSQSAGDDSSHIFGGVTGTARPLFTTSSPRLPSVVLAARSRAALLQNVINGNAQKSASDKVYVKPARNRVEVIADNEQSTEPSSENQYFTKLPEISLNQDDEAASGEEKRVYRRPVANVPSQLLQNSQQQPQHRHREFVRQAPPSDFDYGGPRQFRIPIPQAYPQQIPQGQPAFSRDIYSEQQRDEIDQQYLRETTTTVPKGSGENEPNSEYADYQGQRSRGGRMYLPLPQQQYPQQQQQQSLMIPFAQNPYRPHPGNTLSPYFQNPDRPLTARDFERLLNILVVRHQQLQQYSRLSLSNPYLLGGGGSPVGEGFAGYGGPNQFGYQQIPRPPLYNPYDPRYVGYNRIPYGEYSEQENFYQSQGTADGPNGVANGPVGSQSPYAGKRLVPRKQPQQQYLRDGFGTPSDFYRERYENSETTQPIVQQNPLHQGAEYLPSDIREELLYRMLLLAMQPGGNSQQGGSEQQAASSPDYVTSSKASTTISPNTPKPAVTNTKLRKPVRSVQILGEE